MTKSFSFLFLALLFSAARAAPAPPAAFERDLGDGLFYFRVHALPADLPTDAPKSHPLVLDLRYATATPAGAAALDAWLKFRATADAPVLVLLNAATAPALFPALTTGHRPGAGVITLAPRDADLTPDIAVDVSPRQDRRAYEALAHGATLESLLTDNPDKPRHDEAELVRELSRPPPEDEDDDADDTDLAANGTPPAPPPPAVIDRLLQRAVQIHRGLLALHRIAG